MGKRSNPLETIMTKLPQSAVVLRIGEHKGRDTIDVCKEIIESVKDGEYRGMLFILDTGKGHSKVGATGSYRENLGDGVEAAYFMAYTLAKSRKLVDQHLKPAKARRKPKAATVHSLVPSKD